MTKHAMTMKCVFRLNLLFTLGDHGYLQSGRVQFFRLYEVSASKKSGVGSSEQKISR